MKPLFASIFLLFSALFLVACGDSDSRPKTALVVLHASADAPNVNVIAGSSTLFDDVAFKSGGEVSIATGTRTLSIDARLPGDQTTTVIGPADVTLERDTRYYAAAVGTVAGGGPELLLVEQTATPSSSTVAQVEVAHLAANAPAVDVYVTAPGDPLSGATPLGSFSFKDTLGPVEVPAGDYRVRVTAQGGSSPVFDSGTVSLAGGEAYFVGAVDNTNFGDSPISLIVENDGTVTEVIDADAGAGVRAVHNSYDAPNVDIYVDSMLAGSDLAFPDAFPGAGNDPATDYAALPAGTVNVGITATGDPTVVAAADLDLANGAAYTVLAANAVASLELLPYVDDIRSVATEARVRVIHGAATAPNVDVYAVAQGDTCPGNADALLTDVPYKASSDYLSVPGGDYALCVTTAGTGTVVIGPVDVTLANGGVYTVVAREEAGGASYGVTPLGDF